MLEALVPVKDWLFHHVKNNEMFAGFVGGALIGSLAYYARSIFTKTYSVLRFVFNRRCTMDLTVRNTDEAFIWLSEWINTTSYAKRMRRLRIVDAPRLRKEEEEEPQPQRSKKGPKWTFAAGAGRHWFWHMGRLICFDRELNEESSKGREVMETISLRTIGRSREPLMNILEEARELMNLDTDKTPIFSWSGYYWEKLSEKMPRSLDSVIMDEDIKNTLIQDMIWFHGSQEWYLKRGIPYHRGYLLTGPPGTGKTSLINALGYHFGKSIYTLNLSSVDGDSALESAFFRVPRWGILVLEDVDAAQKKRPDGESKKKKGEDDEDDEKKSITLSGLLNCLDGLPTPEGLIVFMTTNYPESLDKALLRPGRADRRVSLTLLDREQLGRMFINFYGSSQPLNGHNLGGMTAAQVQAILMSHPDDPVEAVAELETSRKEKTWAKQTKKNR